MARGSSLTRGEIWWARMPPPDKTRPVILVSREEAYPRREYVIVAPVTTHARGIAAEIALDASEGLPRPSVANCDSLETIAKSRLVRRIGRLSTHRSDDLDVALKFALGLD